LSDLHIDGSSGQTVGTSTYYLLMDQVAKL